MKLTDEEIDFLWELVDHAKYRDDNTEKEREMCIKLINKFKNWR